MTALSTPFAASAALAEQARRLAAALDAVEAALASGEGEALAEPVRALAAAAREACDG